MRRGARQRSRCSKGNDRWVCDSDQYYEGCVLVIDIFLSVEHQMLANDSKQTWERSRSCVVIVEGVKCDLMALENHMPEKVSQRDTKMAAESCCWRPLCAQIPQYLVVSVALKNIRFEIELPAMVRLC